MNSNNEKNRNSLIKEKIMLILSDDIVFFLSYMSLFVPIMINFSEQNKLCRAGIIISSIFSLLFIGRLLLSIKHIKNDNKLMYYIVPNLLLFITSLLAYVDFTIWGAKNVIMGIYVAYLILNGIISIVKSLTPVYYKSENLFIILISLAILMLVIGGMNQSNSDKEISKLYYIIGFALIFLVTISILLYDVMYLNKKQNKFFKILKVIIGFGTIIFIFPFYIRWCGLKEADFNIFLSVYVSLVGGAMTLIGVAWTIKDNNQKMIDNEKLKKMPYLLMSNSDEDYVLESTKLNFHEEPGALDSKIYWFFILNAFIIKNSNNSDCIVIGVLLNGKFMEFDETRFIERGKTFKIIVTHGYIFKTKPKNIDFHIIVRDLGNNEYKYKCKLLEDGPISETSIDGSSVEIGRIFKVINIELPEVYK